MKARFANFLQAMCTIGNWNPAVTFLYVIPLVIESHVPKLVMACDTQRQNLHRPPQRQTREAGVKKSKQQGFLGQRSKQLILEDYVQLVAVHFSSEGNMQPNGTSLFSA